MPAHHPEAVLQSLREFQTARTRRRLAPMWRRGMLIGAVMADPSAATPALGSPPGLTRVVATYGLDTEPWRHHSARCPDGTAALSAGYEWIGGGNDVRLAELQYTVDTPPTMAWVRARASEDGVDPLAGYGSAWAMRVYIVCASRLLGHHVTWNLPTISTDDSTDVKTGMAKCPAGTSVYGVGGGVHWADRLVIDENWTPNATLSAASVTAQEDEVGTADGWRAWAEAVCAQRLPGLERVGATSMDGSASAKDVIATCPAGKRVVGMGGDIRRAHGEVVIAALAPTHDLTGVRVAAREDDTGTDASWYAAAYAICA